MDERELAELRHVADLSDRFHVLPYIVDGQCAIRYFSCPAGLHPPNRFGLGAYIPFCGQEMMLATTSKLERGAPGCGRCRRTVQWRQITENLALSLVS